MIVFRGSASDSPRTRFGLRDRQALGKREDQLRLGAGERPRRAPAAAESLAQAIVVEATASFGLLKLGNRDDERPIGDQVIVDLTRARAADDGARWEGRSSWPAPWAHRRNRPRRRRRWSGRSEFGRKDDPTSRRPSRG